ncbi:MAG: hypothetical protein WBL63_25525 [Candidatus Acidiferrum sp.]
MMFQRISRKRACPVCKNADVYRVKRAGLSIKVVCRILNLRPHWCPGCDTFFLGPKLSKPAGSQVGTSQQMGSEGMLTSRAWTAYPTEPDG